MGGRMFYKKEDNHELCIAWSAIHGHWWIIQCEFAVTGAINTNQGKYWLQQEDKRCPSDPGQSWRGHLWRRRRRRDIQSAIATEVGKI